MAARMIAAAAVLIGDGIAVLDEISGDFGPRPGLAAAAVRSDRLGADLS